MPRMATPMTVGSPALDQDEPTPSGILREHGERIGAATLGVGVVVGVLRRGCTIATLHATFGALKLRFPQRCCCARVAP